MKIEKHLYNQLKLKKPTGLIKSVTYNRIMGELDDAITERHWVALYGKIGSGKTETVEDCLEVLNDKYSDNVRFINLFWPERSGINIAEIHNQIIYSYGEEYIGTASPKRGKEIRALQVLEIFLEMKERGHHPVLIIDEAHELHGNTLKALKRIREYRYKGKKDLLSIVLIGQPALKKKIDQDKEVRLRCYTYPVNYTKAEKIQIARAHLNTDDIELTTTIAEKYETVGDIISGIRKAMIQCWKMGDDRVHLSHFYFPKEIQQNSKTDQLVDEDALSKLESRIKGKGGKDVEG